MTVNEMKELSKKIINEECIKYNVELEYCPITFIENLNKQLNDNYSLNRKVYEFANSICNKGLFNQLSNSICLYLSNFEIIEMFDGSEECLIHLIKTTYHEMKHKLQWENIYLNNPENFIHFIENICIKYNNKDYKLHHDDYLIEIDADEYGWNMTKQYFDKINNDKYDDIISKNKDNVELRKALYNSQNKIDMFNSILRKNPDIINKCPFLKTFYDEKGDFKDINDIVKNDNFFNFNKQIINLLFSSEDFLNNVRYDQLNDYTNDRLVGVLKSTYENNIKRRKHIKELLQSQKIDNKMWLKNDIETVDKIKIMQTRISNLLKNQLDKKQIQNQNDDIIENLTKLR